MARSQANKQLYWLQANDRSTDRLLVNTSTDSKLTDNSIGDKLMNSSDSSFDSKLMNSSTDRLLVNNCADKELTNENINKDNKSIGDANGDHTDDFFNDQHGDLRTTGPMNEPISELIEDRKWMYRGSRRIEGCSSSA